MFDLGFLNAELERAKKAAVARERLVDTLMLARRKHPGGSNRLDDLCARYKIDNSSGIKHGALLDAELLAEVYVELIGARQANLGLAATDIGAGDDARDGDHRAHAPAAARAAGCSGGARRPPRVHRDAGRSRGVAEIPPGWDGPVRCSGKESRTLIGTFPRQKCARDSQSELGSCADKSASMFPRSWLSKSARLRCKNTEPARGRIRNGSE